jgi:hypothetical protein
VQLATATDPKEIEYLNRVTRLDIDEQNRKFAEDNEDAIFP